MNAFYFKYLEKSLKFYVWEACAAIRQHLEKLFSRQKNFARDERTLLARKLKKNKRKQKQTNKQTNKKQ